MDQPLNSQFSAAAAGSASLAEVLGAFSYALDLTEGQPAGHSIRACWIGLQIGQAIGLGDEALRDVYYAVLLKDLGCSSNAARVCEMFQGDDRQLKHDFKLIGPAAADFGAFVNQSVAADAGAAQRRAAITHLLDNAGSIMTGLIETRCTRGADIARQLRFSESVALAIAGLDEHWDGSGLPAGIAGDAIPLASRIALLAQVADVFFMAGGANAARTEVMARRGGWLDPALVHCFIAISRTAAFWEVLGAADLDVQLLALEPAQHRISVDENWLDCIAAAFGQVIDSKSPYTGGHSERVGLFTDLVAQKLGFGEARRRPLRRAAILHDLGKLGVSSRVLEKPGKLDDGEWAIMQSHAALTMDILSRIGVLRDMALIAGSHHERLDGKGYPLGLDARMIALETRIISVADFFDALTADRPYRAAMPVDKALSIMASEVGGAIDGDCFAALQSVVQSGIPQKPLPVLGGDITQG